jgi:hypothetical protein
MRDDAKKSDYLDYSKNSSHSDQETVNDNEDDEDDLNEEELFFIKKERCENRNYESSRNMVGLTSNDIVDGNSELNTNN